MILNEFEDHVSEESENICREEPIMHNKEQSKTLVFYA